MIDGSGRKAGGKMRAGQTMRGWCVAAMLAAALPVALSGAAMAQGQFSPVITVNERAITGWEIDQRSRILQFFRTPGDLEQQAIDGLIEDRLRQQELARVGLVLTEEGYAQALEEFAARADLTGEQLIVLLGQNGIDETTLRDFLAVGTAWRDYVRQLYASRVEISESEIDAALARSATEEAGLDILLNEIIIPAPPDRIEEVRALAFELSQLTTTAEFEAAAREVSAVPSREQGGQIDWAPVSNYPPALQSVLLGLEPGRVTPPIELENAVALLQLRAVRERGFVAATPAALDYAVLRIPGGRSTQGLTEAATIAANIDTCNDLYEWVREQGIAQDRLFRDRVAPGAIPQDIALELAKLDANEMSWNLTDAGGQTLLFVMLCQREGALPEGATREDIARQLQSQKLQGYAEALLADLRAQATIVGE
jgi:peptidyl-prolyl cis-trans isomerase SurA